VLRRKPGRLAPIFALVVAFAPLARTAHAQPEAWPQEDPIPLPPARVEQPPPPPRSTRDILREDTNIGARYRSARAMAVGGGVTMGVGIGLALTAGAVAFFTAPWASEDGEGEPVDYEARRGDRITVVGLLVVAGAATIGGATLLGIGVHRKRAVVAEARRVSFGLGRGGLALRF
jgi:hypothetical protein